MKSQNVEDCEKGYKSDDILNTRRLGSINKSKDPLVEINAKIERLKEPPPKKGLCIFDANWVEWNGHKSLPTKSELKCGIGEACQHLWKGNSVVKVSLHGMSKPRHQSQG
jgi:hypothetical protein